MSSAGPRRASGRSASLATLAGVLALAGSLVVAIVGLSPAGTSGAGSNASVAGGLVAANSSAVGYVPSGLAINRSWPVQSASISDFTRDAGIYSITSRTDVGVRSALSTGLVALARISCGGDRSANPSSDHPRGKACDFMQTYTTSAGVQIGWRLANWFVANQAVLGVNYVIWQNQIWVAGSPSRWTPYQSAAYGCPDPTNITGCHMDHVHVSFY